MTISVVIATVDGRERQLAACVAAYNLTTFHPLEVIVVRNRPGVASAWQWGAEQASGEYLHLTCDDIEPMTGWDVAAVRAADNGTQPAPRLFNTDGTPWDGAPPEYDPREVRDGSPVPLGSLPFMRRSMWEHVTPLPPGMHYFADNWVTWQLDRHGVPTVMCYGYDFVHSWATEHRGAGFPPNERGPVDAQYIRMATMIVERGEAGLR